MCFSDKKQPLVGAVCRFVITIGKLDATCPFCPFLVIAKDMGLYRCHLMELGHKKGLHGLHKLQPALCRDVSAIIASCRDGSRHLE